MASGLGMKKGLVLLAALLIAGPAMAAKGSTVDVTGPVTFSEQRNQVMLDLADGETYAEISPEDRAKVVSSLDRMERLLDAGETPQAIQAMHPNDRVDLINEQEVINTILTRAQADSRMVCRREIPVGTRMPTNVCRTVAESRRLRENSRQQFEHAGRGRANTIF